jgi:hypothetical protein
MLFANHYAENWFSLWETRWYTGFSVVSYPPLTHQLIALFIPILGFDKAFALVLWIVTSLYPLGIYAFSRVFTGKTSSSYGALASAILLPIYVSAHIFGQLPFLASTLTALFAAASLDRYLRNGGIHNFTLSVALITTSMGMHHATLLVHPFFIFAVVLNALFQDKKQFHKIWRVICKRLVFFGAVSVVTGTIVIFPFWHWAASQVMQTPIDHLSRHNFLTDRLAISIFFFPLYGPLLGVIPFLFRKWDYRFMGLLISFALLFLFGLGGTTPLPRIIFGSAWEWLTYDRFAFWSSLTLTPFFGILFIQLKNRVRNRVISKPDRSAPTPAKTVTLKRISLSTLIFYFFGVTALGAWFTPMLFPIQPKPVDMQPVTDFLNQEDNSQWRYVTLGFGDQFAYLNLLTSATTIDGSYHTARTLPELHHSGVGQIDTAYWAPEWMRDIEPILKKSGDYGVRWGFVNLEIQQEIKSDGIIATHGSPFVTLLEKLHWKEIKTLDNGILIFENLAARLPEPVDPPAVPFIFFFSWGILPILAFVTASALGMLRVYPVQSERIIRLVYSILIGLTPLALCFWVYRTIGDFSHSRVYFTYDNALFFLSDAIVLLAVTLWLTVKISHRSGKAILFSFTSPKSLPTFLLFTIISLATISIFWSRDWRVSLYVSLHLWFILFFILSLRDWHQSWKFVMFGFCLALSVQVIAGFMGFALQSTAYLEILDMKWPGILDPAMRGASVVQLADGVRILRAYGTLVHPNILGGLALVTLLGPASLYLTGKRPNYPALMLFSLGIILIGLTFSRSAWLGFIFFIAILLLKSRHLDGNRLGLLVSITVLTGIIFLASHHGLVFIRISNAPVATEQLSTFGRSWLTEQALGIIHGHPLTGVGIGSFIIELAQYAIEGAIIEPVHNVFLLAGSELGIAGMILVICLFFSIAANVLKARTRPAILASATITGLGVISLFDHYLWTLAPGRTLLGLALGLWIGQVIDDA